MEVALGARSKAVINTVKDEDFVEPTGAALAAKWTDARKGNKNEAFVQPMEALIYVPLKDVKK